MSINTQRSAVALRNIIVGTVGGAFDSTDPDDSLVGVNTSLYPDGTLAYVVSMGWTFRLAKTSTLTPTTDGGIIAPLSGPGRWFFVGGALNDPRVTEAVGTTTLQALSFVVVQDTWIGMPSNPALYVSENASGSWTLNTTTGVFTYNGPSNADYLCTASVAISSATAAETVEVAVMTNADSVIGTTTYVGSAGRTAVPPTTANLAVFLSTSRVESMQNGNTLFVAVRNRSGAHNLVVAQYSLVLTPA